MNHQITRAPYWLALTVSILLAAACGDDSDGPSASPAGSPTPAVTTAASATSAPTPAPTPAPSPTARPAAFDPAKLPQALLATDRVTTLIGAGFQTLRDKSTDPQLPFSSVPTMSATLTAQGVSLIYNSFQAGAAPPAGRPFAAQNTVQGYPSATNAGTAFTALRTTWQGTLFQNVTTETAPAGWEESFCQLGNFTTTGGQAQQWFVCMARSGPYVATVSVGGFPGLDANSVGTAVRAYFDGALAALK